MLITFTNLFSITLSLFISQPIRLPGSAFFVFPWVIKLELFSTVQLYHKVLEAPAITARKFDTRLGQAIFEVGSMALGSKISEHICFTFFKVIAWVVKGSCFARLSIWSNYTN